MIILALILIPFYSAGINTWMAACSHSPAQIM